MRRRVENLLTANAPGNPGNQVSHMSLPSRLRFVAALLAFLAVFTLAPTKARAGDVQLAVGLGGEGLELARRRRRLRIAPAQLPLRGSDRALLPRAHRLRGGRSAHAHLPLARRAGLGPHRQDAPFARFGLVHQHEETISSVAAEPFGAVFGVGDGIRHRAGLDGGLGVDIPFAKQKAWEFHARVELLLTGFPDVRGPAIYGGGNLGVGLNYAL